MSTRQEVRDVGKLSPSECYKGDSGHGTMPSHQGNPGFKEISQRSNAHSGTFLIMSHTVLSRSSLGCIYVNGNHRDDRMPPLEHGKPASTRDALYKSQRHPMFSSHHPPPRIDKINRGVFSAVIKSLLERQAGEGQASPLHQPHRPCQQVQFPSAVSTTSARTKSLCVLPFLWERGSLLGWNSAAGHKGRAVKDVSACA